MGEQEEHSADWYRLLVENTSDVVYRISPDGIIEWISPAVHDVLGWAVADLIGQDVRTLLAVDEGAIVIDPRGAAEGRFPIRIRARDGSYRWMSGVGRPILGDDGALIGVVGSARDVHREVEAERALAASERRLRLLVEQSSVGRCITGVHGEYLEVNAALCSILGRSADELMQMTWLDVVHPDDAEVDREAMQGLLAGRLDSVRGRRRYLLPDGRVVWGLISVSPVRDDDGQVSSFIVEHVDVTSEVEAQLRLEESEREYRLIAENASDVVLTTSPDRFVTWVAPSVSRTLGWGPDDLVGHRMAEFTHPEDLAQADSSRDRVYGGQPGEIVARIRTKSGEYRWMSGRGMPTRDDDGRIVAVAMGMRDIDDVMRTLQRAESDEALLRAVSDSMLDPQVLLAPLTSDASDAVDFRFVAANHAAREVLGIDDVEPITASLRAVLPGLIDGRLLTGLRQVLDDGVPLAIDDLRYRSGRFGRELRMDVRATRADDLVALTWRDVTDRFDALQRIAESEEKYRLLARNATDVVVHVRDHVVQWVSPSVVDVMGGEPDSWIGLSVLDLLDPESIPIYREAMQRVVLGEYMRRRLRILDVDGEYRWMDVSARPYVNAQGAMDGVIASMRDVTRQWENEQALAASEERFRLLAENSSDVVLLMSGASILWVSPALTRMLGWEPVDWAGHDVLTFVHAEDAATLQEQLAQVDTGQTVVTRVRVHDRAGQMRWVEVHAGPIQEASDREPGIVASFRTVDAEVAAEKALERLARFDEVTGVLARSAVLRLLSSQPDARRQVGTTRAVLFCDLDDFKGINDRYGHAAGDTVLRSVAGRITRLVRHGDLVARIGGDELLVVLEGVHSLQEAEEIAEKVRLACEEPIHCNGRPVIATVSIGVTTAAPGEDVDLLLARADEAMYQAKHAGRNRVFVASPSSGHEARASAL